MLGHEGAIAIFMNGYISGNPGRKVLIFEIVAKLRLQLTNYCGGIEEFVLQKVPCRRSVFRIIL